MNAIARIFVNQIEVGSLPASQYRYIAKQARRDWRLWVGQLFNLFTVFAQFLAAAIRIIPFVWFIAFVGLTIFSPKDTINLFASLPIITPEKLSEDFQLLLRVSLILSILYLGVEGILTAASEKPGKFGYVNMFDDAIAQEIREVLEVPAKGRVHIRIEEIADAGFE